MADMPPVDLAPLMDPGKSASGFDESHFIARALFNKIGNFLSVTADDPANTNALPNRNRGALVLNVSKHARQAAFQRPTGYGEPPPPGWKSPTEPRPIDNP